MIKLEKYLPENSNKELIQAHIETSVIKKILTYKNKHKISWSTLLTALFERLIDEETL